MNQLKVGVYRMQKQNLWYMKYAFFFLMLIAFSSRATDFPETIFPKTKIIRSSDWYSGQADLWRQEVSKNKLNASAWLNYYAAARYAQASQNLLTSIVEEMKGSISTGFEYNLILSWNNGLNEESLRYLLKAYDFEPNNPSTYSQLILFEEFYFNTDKRKTFSEKLFKTNLISTSLLNYSYNVLMSVEEDGVLITEGDHTAIPLFLLQDQLGIGKKVTVLDLDLLQDPTYRTRKLKEANLSFDERATTEDIKKSICLNLPSQNPTKRFYYALTLAKENMDPVKDQLFVVGLASQLSRERLDNVSIIKQNIENRFLVDYLTVDLNGESEFAAGKVYRSNYLVPLLILNDYYKSLNESEKSKEIETIVLAIANQTGQTTVVNNYIGRNKVVANPFSVFDPGSKAHEVPVRQVKGNFYAGEREVTNEMYNRFLDYLQKKGLNDLYEKHKIDLSQYTEPALSMMANYSAPRTPTRKEKYFTQYPVVNVSYESAMVYCEWLTEQYNNDPVHKFKKVKFTLPTISQWQISALGYKEFQSWELEENMVKVIIPKEGDDRFGEGDPKMIPVKGSDIRYPWFNWYKYRNQPLNNHGCSLGNFKYPSSMGSCNPKYKANTPDGYLAMSPTATYFPNDLGLFDVVGNVAEMTLVKGKACGGSWNHSPEESTIGSINEYTGPDAAVGFRIFMEVIEP